METGEPAESAEDPADSCSEPAGSEDKLASGSAAELAPEVSPAAAPEAPDGVDGSACSAEMDDGSEEIPPESTAAS